MFNPGELTLEHVFQTRVVKELWTKSKIYSIQWESIMYFVAYHSLKIVVFGIKIKTDNMSKGAVTRFVETHNIWRLSWTLAVKKTTSVW